jgi:predicted outer membrane repeat protein
MRNRMLAAMAVSAVVVTGAGGTAAQAAPAARVPCDAASLAAAIRGAVDGATLSLTSGCTYVLTAALPAIIHDLTIAGNGATLRRSTAPGTPAFSILRVTGGALTVGDLNFRHGGGPAVLGGGAISDTGDGQLTITGGTFTGNTAANGGAIFDIPPEGLVAPVITGAVFTGNSAARGDGGAIYNDSFLVSLTCDDCTFRDNTTVGDGGAVFDNGFTSGGLSGTFAGNTAGADGGAVWTDDAGGEGISGTFRSNAAGGNGGAIYIGDAAYDVGIGGFIAWNTAGGNGGGIYDGGQATYLEDASITGNRAAGDGGGLDDSLDGEASLTGTRVTANRAAAGGGIYATGSFSFPSLESSTVTGNRPDNCEPLGSIAGCTG